jgi:tetratricopeptide (TPR) repeat protein
MVLPLNLVPFYPYPRIVTVLSWEYLLPAILVSGMMISSVVIAKKQKLWLSVWGYYATTLLPVLGIVRVGSQELADRYTYLPSLGPFLLVGLGIAWIWKKAGAIKKWGSTVRIISSVIVVSTFVCISYSTVRQVGIWKNSYTLWTRVIEKEPAGRYRAYKNRAIYFSGLNQFDKAIADYDVLISIDPSYYEAYILRQVAVEALLDRGKFYLGQGNRELAVPDFQNACQAGDIRGCAALKELGIPTDRQEH